MLYKLLHCVIVAVSLVKVESLEFGDRVCTTDDCKIIAKNINESINTEVEPCDNFYEYACGNWMGEKPFSDDFQPRNHWHMKFETIRSRTKGLLKAKSEPNEVEPIKQARKWYKQCMDEKSIEASGVEPIQSILKDIGGWPMAMNKEDWNETKFPWTKVNRYFFRKTGGYYFWDVQTIGAKGNDTLGSVILSDSAFRMPEVSPQLGDDITSPSWENYRLLISDVVKIFTKSNRVTIDEARLLEETNELISFQMELYEMSVKEKSSEYQYWWKDIQIGGKNISKKYDGASNSTFDYDIIIDDLFDTARVKTIVEEPLAIWTDNVFYLESLPEFLRSVPQRIIVNYLHWCFIAEMSWFMNKEMRDTGLYYSTQKFGSIEPGPRESECRDLFFESMIHVVSYLYVQQYFTETTEKSAQDMIRNIRSAFDDKIQNSKWLGEKPKVSAKELIDEMEIFIAFPDWYNNPSALTEYYKEFRTESTFLHTRLEFMKFRARKNFEKVLIQEPQFNGAVNYGMAGYVVGHEMAHAFTGTGMCALTNPDLTSLSTSEVETIHDRAACFICQFDEYFGYSTAEAELIWPCRVLDGDYRYDRYGENKSASQLSQSENIADTTGIQTAFLAFEKTTKNVYPRRAEKLPDLEQYTDDQLFFLSFANYYCTTMDDLEFRGTMSTHSRPDYRVNSAVSNTVKFAEAFNCPTGKPMNPEKKCNIWDE